MPLLKVLFALNMLSSDITPAECHLQWNPPAAQEPRARCHSGSVHHMQGGMNALPRSGHPGLLTNMNCTCWTPQPHVCGHVCSSLVQVLLARENTLACSGQRACSTQYEQCRCLSFPISAVQRDGAQAGMGRCSNSS